MMYMETESFPLVGAGYSSPSAEGGERAQEESLQRGCEWFISVSLTTLALCNGNLLPLLGDALGVSGEEAQWR